MTDDKQSDDDNDLTRMLRLEANALRLIESSVHLLHGEILLHNDDIAIPSTLTDMENARRGIRTAIVALENAAEVIGKADTERTSN